MHIFRTKITFIVKTSILFVVVFVFPILFIFSLIGGFSLNVISFIIILITFLICFFGFKLLTAKNKYIIIDNFDLKYRYGSENSLVNIDLRNCIVGYYLSTSETTGEVLGYQMMIININELINCTEDILQIKKDLRCNNFLNKSQFKDIITICFNKAYKVIEYNPYIIDKEYYIKLINPSDLKNLVSMGLIDKEKKYSESISDNNDTVIIEVDQNNVTKGKIIEKQSIWICENCGNHNELYLVKCKKCSKFLIE